MTPQKKQPAELPSPGGLIRQERRAAPLSVSILPQMPQSGNTSLDRIERQLNQEKHLFFGYRDHGAARLADVHAKRYRRLIRWKKALLRRGLPLALPDWETWCKERDARGWPRWEGE